jgi:hypothetical protein
MIAKFIKLVKTHKADIVLVIAIVLISITSFNLGKMSMLKTSKPPLTVTQPQNMAQISSKSPTSPKPTPVRDQTVVASKNSKLYHFTYCPGASKIADKNKLTFPNEAAAISAGLTLASNCNK